jgi:hypothetical protein
MRPRTELLLGSAVVLLLAIAGGALGLRRARVSDADIRRSTFLNGPLGAGAYAEALDRLGVRVDRFRRPVASLPGAIPSGALVAFLDPDRDLDSREGAAIAGLRADLLLAGVGAEWAIRCLGYEVEPRGRDSVRMLPPAGGEPMPRARAVLVPRGARTATDSSGAADAAAVSCTAPAARAVDTLLRTSAGRPVAIRAALDDGRTVTLVADGRLFANRALRSSGAGPFALGLVVPRYRRLLVDEYHHGYDATGSLAGATMEWTLHSPWGWAVLQLAAVGVLALVASGVRFGPVRAGIERRRRSPLEHVRALATALAAARGHDVAVGLLVQGLKRRLSGAGRYAPGQAGEWLEGMAPAVRTARGRAALDRLVAVTGRPATAEDVLQVANDVETLWEELTPT